ncbi:uncharacterized protein LOC115694486 [Syzygium oleosum]|uniref:uncharacterized protein LOC115694486 n=1 Tax=Syzygium oleosum TaxID=219896 RepID=UPI0024B9F82E|nr:uncharacterized protein LOC115694486 [Syzygium oleosum]
MGPKWGHFGRCWTRPYSYKVRPGPFPPDASVHSLAVCSSRRSFLAMDTDEEGSPARASVSVPVRQAAGFSGEDGVSGIWRRICWPWSHGGLRKKVGGASSLQFARGCGGSFLGKCITSLCWHPDGKVVLGLEDGTGLLHDVENASGCSLAFEDRTTRFFLLAPRVPIMLGLVPGDATLTDDVQDSFVKLSNSSKQCFHILCNGDKDGR